MSVDKGTHPGLTPNGDSNDNLRPAIKANASRLWMLTLEQRKELK